MSIYRLAGSKIWWYEFRFANQRIRESTKTRSKTLAVDAERNRRSELERAYNGVKKRASAKLFGVAADEWLGVKGLTLAASSLRIEKDNLKHIRPFFERLLVTDIDAGDIAEYQKIRLSAEASPKTINLEVGTIRSILRRNRVWAEIQPDVGMLPTRDDVGKALTTDEEGVLLQGCLKSRSRSLYPAVVLALNSGMRYSEIRLLQWKQIDFCGRTLLVGKSKTESGTGRTIPLNRRILAVMEMWAAHFPHRRPEHFVFPSEKYGAGTDDFKPCVYGTDATRPINDWKEAWEGAKKRAGAVLMPQARTPGLPRMLEVVHRPLQCRFHDLRHTACTRLLEGGVPYAVVATIMGWSASTAIRMAKRYGHIGQRAMREAMEVLEIAEITLGSPKNPPKSEASEAKRFN
jgi:integrase